MEKVISVVIIVLVLWLLLKILSAPFRLIFKLLLNALVGLVILFAFNLVGSAFGFTLNISPVTCLVSGILGIPGVIILILLKIFF